MLKNIVNHKYFPKFINQGELFNLRNLTTEPVNRSIILNAISPKIKSLPIKIIGPILVSLSILTYFVNSFISSIVLLIISPFFFLSRRDSIVDELIYTLCHTILRVNLVNHSGVSMVLWPLVLVPYTDFSFTDIVLTLMLIPLLPRTLIIACLALEAYYLYKNINKWWPVPIVAFFYGMIMHFVQSPFTQITTFMAMCSMAMRLKLDGWFGYSPMELQSKFLSWYLAGPMISGCISYMGTIFGIISLILSSVWEGIYWIAVFMSLVSLERQNLFEGQ